MNEQMRARMMELMAERQSEIVTDADLMRVTAEVAEKLMDEFDNEV